MPVSAPTQPGDSTTPTSGPLRAAATRVEYRLRRRLPELVAFATAAAAAAGYVFAATTGVVWWVTHGLLGLSVACLVAGCTSRVDRRNDARVREVRGHVDGMATRLVGQTYAAHAELLAQMRHVHAEETAVLRAVAVWARDIQRQVVALHNEDACGEGGCGLWEMDDREMRAYFLGFYDRLG